MRIGDCGVCTRLDLDHRLLRALAAVIAGELAERAFHLGVAGMQQALDHELGVGRDRQADVFGLGQFDRAAHDATGDVELRLLGAEHLRRQHEQHRIDAVSRDHLARLAARPPGLAIEPAVLARRAVEPDPARPVQHLPVAADIDAAGLGIAREVMSPVPM